MRMGCTVHQERRSIRVVAQTSPKYAALPRYGFPSTLRAVAAELPHPFQRLFEWSQKGNNHAICAGYASCMDALLSLGSKATLPLDILSGLTLLTLAPFLIITTTSFLRITVVLSLVRSAIGASALPPNAVITALALALSFAVMSPTADAIMKGAIQPYQAGRITQSAMFAAAEKPVRAFMLRQTQSRDLRLFAVVGHRPASEATANAPLSVLIPAFVVNELRNGFGIGFALYLPFIAIDIAVAAILMGMGMMMLSPNVISLPCKLLLFVLVDGWAMVCAGVVTSFR